jgi:hypothetical protein
MPDTSSPLPVPICQYKRVLRINRAHQTRHPHTIPKSLHDAPLPILVLEFHRCHHRLHHRHCSRMPRRMQPSTAILDSDNSRDMYQPASVLVHQRRTKHSNGLHDHHPSHASGKEFEPPETTEMAASGRFLFRRRVSPYHRPKTSVGIDTLLFIACASFPSSVCSPF